MNVLFFLLLCSSLYLSLHHNASHHANNTNLTALIKVCNLTEIDKDYSNGENFEEEARNKFFQNLKINKKIEETAKNISKEFKIIHKAFENWLEDLKKKEQIKYIDYSKALSFNKHKLKKNEKLKTKLDFEDASKNDTKAKLEGKEQAANTKLKKLRKKLNQNQKNTNSTTSKTNKQFTRYEQNVKKYKQLNKEMEKLKEGNKTKHNANKTSILKKHIKKLNDTIHNDMIHLNHQTDNSEYLNKKLHHQVKEFSKVLKSKNKIKNDKLSIKPLHKSEKVKNEKILKQITISKENINKLKTKLKKCSKKIEEAQHIKQGGISKFLNKYFYNNKKNEEEKSPKNNSKLISAKQNSHKKILQKKKNLKKEKPVNS